MKIQVLGMGCAKCRALAANVETAIAELGIDAQVEKVEGIADIARMGVMMTPALAVDGQVLAAGQLLTVARIRDMLQAHNATESAS
jgi:small redox-active disulfide protein 2